MIPTLGVITALPVVPTWRTGTADCWVGVTFWDEVDLSFRATMTAIPLPTSAPTAKTAP